MRAAVTGGTGFVGSHLVEALRARGDEVRCLVRKAAFEEAIAATGAGCVRGDLHDERALEALVEGAEVVYHVAGRIAAPSEAELLRVNRDGTVRALAAARRAGVGRFLYVSSLAVTGPTVPGHSPDESGVPKPVTAYGRSKRSGEEVVSGGEIPFTIVRPPVVFGPRDREVLRLFRMARWALVPVIQGGTQELSLVYAPELAQALVAAARSPATAGRTYHAGHPDVVTQRWVVEAIAQAVGARARVLSLPGPVVRAALRVTGAAARLRGRASLLDPSKAEELLAPAWTCSSAALQRDTGWQATRPLADALADTARWYRQAGWL